MKNFVSIMAAGTFLFLAQVTSAQSTTSDTASGATTAAAAQISSTESFRLQAPSFGPMKLKAGIKSTNTSGRLYDLDNESGTRFKQKHEYFLGAVHASGWGAYGQAVTSGTSYGDSSRNNLGAGDPSLTILHPDFYKSSNLTLSGQMRRYFPVTDRSVNRSQRQYAYYFYTTYKMPAQWVVWNQSTPRYFDQSFYKDGDTNYYFEDITTLTKNVNRWFAYGFSQWTQVEWHQSAATGTSVDVSVFSRFTPIANVTIEPRFILPAHVRNTVYDAAPRVGLNAFRAELYAQMAL